MSSSPSAAPGTSSPIHEDVDQFTLLFAQEHELKKKIQELETKRIVESIRYEEQIVSLTNQIKELNVIRDREREKTENLTEEVDYWKEEWHWVSGLAKNCELYEEKVKKLEAELEMERKKAKQLEEMRPRGAAEKGIEGMVELFKQECYRICGTGVPVESVERFDLFASKLKEMRSDEMRAALNSCPVPICQICTLPFDDILMRTPRMLTCGHTVCEECAENLAAANLSLVTQYGGPSIACPFDRTKTFVSGGVKSLPKNFTVLECINGDN